MRAGYGRHVPILTIMQAQDAAGAPAYRPANPG